MNVMGWADQHLDRFGEFDALVFEDRVWTNRQLHDESCRLAGGLLARGLQPGQSVGLPFGNIPELVIAFTAVIRAGGVAVIGGEAQGFAFERGAPLLQPVEREDGDLAQMLFTSGTTGPPRSVSWRHGALRERYLPFADTRSPSAPARRTLCALPLAAAFGAQYLYLRLLQKMQLILVERFEPRLVLDLIDRHQVQTAMLVPSMVEALLAVPGGDLSSLSSVLVGGSAVSPSLVARFRRRFGVRLTTVYGLAELGPVAQSAPGSIRGTVGKPRLDVRIVDGEVEVRDVHSQEWFATGDLGCLEPDGQLRLLGRSKDIIIQGGVNLYPHALEEGLLALPGVADCAVIGLPEPYLGEEVVACIVGTVSEVEIFRHCPATRVYSFEALPRNAGGKVDKFQLRAIAEARRAETRATPPLTEREVVELWPSELDSLASVQLVYRLSARVGRPLPATLAFNYPSPEAMFRHLSGADPVPERRRRPAGLEPVAIVGMACRLGGADTPERFWELLTRGDEAPRLDVDGFDAGFFGFTPREAQALDPQHRMAMEVCWQALESAGYDPPGPDLCGLFLGIAASRYPTRDPLGAQPSMAPGRIAHLLNLQGPVLALDTSCSSSLAAVHTAMQGLRLGQFDMALAGGVHAIGSPDSTAALAKLGVLAADGRCKAYDASADGFGRGEGCVMFVLKRLSDALADGNPIRAVLRGSALNHDGHSSSLTAPNGLAQTAVLRAALEDAELTTVDFLEAHGTGTPLGDPIEMEAALAALPTRPLPIGSVKSNVGHLEAAAGAVGVLKAVLALEHGQLPAHLHFRQLHPALQRFASEIVIPTKLTSWALQTGAVTSMGMSGTNGCVVLEKAPLRLQPPSPGEHILCVSARSDAALVSARQAVADGLRDPVGDFCYTSSVGRRHFEKRIAVVGRNAPELRQRLLQATPSAAGRCKVAFVFSGQGSPGVDCRELAFLEAMEACARFADLSQPQPAHFARQWSWAQLWKSWGVEPDIVVGHSLGEYAAACVAGVFTLQDGLRWVQARGQLMVGVGGGMLAVESVPDASKDCDVAAINGPGRFVLSGSEAALAGIPGLRLEVPTAFHSRLLDPILADFEKITTLPLSPPRLDFVSTVTGRRASGELCSPTYWRDGMRHTVQFGAAMETLAAEGANVFLKVGSRPALTELAELYQAGVNPRWEAISTGRRVAFPTYPFQRGAAPKAPIPVTIADLVGPTVGPHDNLLEHGFDSLRIMQFLADLQRHFGLVLTAADFLAHPTLAGLQRVSSTVVVLRKAGSGSPLFCMHPAGGQIACYLHPAQQLDRPVYAIQSRALLDPAHEHATLAEMAESYASLVQEACPSGPIALLGWSLGALTAQAVAGLLEQRGRSVDSVTLIDPPRPAQAIPSRSTDALYLRHLELVARHEEAPVRAPVHVFWAGPPANPWPGAARETVLGGDHYTIMQNPRLWSGLPGSLANLEMHVNHGDPQGLP